LNVVENAYMSGEFDGLRLIESVLGIDASMLAFGLLGVGAVLLGGALLWPGRERSAAAPADLSSLQSRAPG
jgi:hypothetical protein